MHFTKMNGAGNDFIILENLDRALAHQALPDIARALCDRRMSIGADGLMVLEPADSGAADFRMLFYNSDGGASAATALSTGCLAKCSASRPRRALSPAAARTKAITALR